MVGLSHAVAGPHNDFYGMFSLARSVNEVRIDVLDPLLSPGNTNPLPVQRTISC
jgi:hypothetical protein